MKRKIFVKIAVVIVLAFALCGCNAEKPVEDEREQGNSSPESSISQEETTTTTQEIFTTPSVSDTVADDEQLQTDLTNFVSIFTEHDLEITDMQVIKRQTTVEDKVDIVYVSGSAANEDVKFNFNYKMTYNLYNDGWILDEVVEDGYGCAAHPLKRAPDYMIEDKINDSMTTPHFVYSSYEILDITADLNSGQTYVSVSFTLDYDAGREVTSYTYIFEFNSSRMEWEYDKVDSSTHESDTIYDLEGIWEGEDYSVEITMSDNTNLSTAFVNVTDLRTGKLVYSGQGTYGGAFSAVGFIDRYNNGFTFHNHDRFEPYHSLGMIYSTTEGIAYNLDGVFYGHDSHYEPLTKVS